MWRQGDVLVQAIDAIPRDVEARPDLVLVEGVATGHRHEIKPARSARLFERGATMYLDVRDAQVELVHPEHGPITLVKGAYRVWRQREYDGIGEARPVVD